MLNRVILIGRPTRDPELRYSPAGKAVTKFTIACDRTGGDSADFIPVVCFDKIAETCANYVRKGKLVAIEGRWQTGRYENNEGKKVYTNDCLAFNIRFLERAEAGQNSNPTDGDLEKRDPFADDGKPIDLPKENVPW
ncbi:Single-stranded DNA-binding protein ssb [compost metagenome]